MKYVGFIKEYNIIDSAKPLQDVIKYHDVKPDYLDIINYLKDGILAFAWMGYFVDIETKALIAPDSYFILQVIFRPGDFFCLYSAHRFIKLSLFRL